MTDAPAQHPAPSALRRLPWWSCQDRDWRTLLIIGLVTGVVYYATARLGLALRSQPENIAVFWPAAGFAAGALVALGPSARWPIAIAVAVTTLGANILARSNIDAGLVFAVCNAIECIVFAWFFTRLDRADGPLESLASVALFLSTAVTAPAIAAVPAAMALHLLGLSTSPLVDLWWSWLESDSIGIITVAPLLITLPALLREPPSKVLLVESAIALVLTIIAAAFAYSLRPVSAAWLIITPVTVLFPLFMWLAGRMPPALSAAAALMVPFVIVMTAVLGIGRLGDGAIPAPQRVAAAQVAILASSLCALALSAMFARLRKDADRIRSSEERLRGALVAGGVFSFAQDVATGAVERSPNAAEILGITQAEAQMGRQPFLERIHPEDRGALQAATSQLEPDAPSARLTVRFVKPDGNIAWLGLSGTGTFDERGRLVEFNGLARDVTERQLAQAKQAELIAELNHRVKNTLAVMGAVIDSSRLGHETLDDYIASLDGRIESMKRTHERLSANSWSGLSLAMLLEGELAPYRAPGNVTLSGPDVNLPASTAQSLACTLHELATNAAKYGALSTPGGTLSVDWRIGADPEIGRLLHLTWLEHTTAEVGPPQREAYGLFVIRNQLTYEQDATVDLRFDPGGVRFEIELPIVGMQRHDRKGLA